MIGELNQLQEAAKVFGLDWVGLFAVMVVSYLFVRVFQVKKIKLLDALLPLIPLFMGIIWAALTTKEGGTMAILKSGIYLGAVAAVLYKLARPFIKKFETSDSSNPGE